MRRWLRRVRRWLLNTRIGPWGMPSSKWCVHAIFEPRDIWIGVYWTRDYGSECMRIYVCLLPCLPITFTREDW